MSSRSENLICPVCHDVFKDPVVLPCSHTFCKACWQRCWTQHSSHKCPVCRKNCSSYEPVRVLALKNICEAFSMEGVERRSAAVCGLHSEDLKLFCLDHQQLVCVICQHSSSHTGHSFRPAGEAAMDYKEALRVLLEPWQQKLVLSNDIKGNFDQTAEDIEVQARDTERQINDECSMLQKLLQQQQRERIAAVQKEKTQKSQVIKRKSEALSSEIAALSYTVRTTEDVLREEDLTFLQKYKTAAELVDRLQITDPQPVPGGLIDTAKHLNNLPSAVWDSVKKMIPQSQVLDPKPNPEPPRSGSQRINPHQLYCYQQEYTAVSSTPRIYPHQRAYEEEDDLFG